MEFTGLKPPPEEKILMMLLILFQNLPTAAMGQSLKPDQLLLQAGHFFEPLHLEQATFPSPPH